MTVIADVFTKLETPKNLVRYIFKGLVSADPWTGNIVNWPKNCCNLNDSIVTIFTDHSERN